MAKRTVHSEEIKKEALDMHRTGETPRAIADSLKVPKTTVHNWINAAGVTRGASAPKAGARASTSASASGASVASESDLVRSLRARVRTLESERATLKATIAIFAGAA